MTARRLGSFVAPFLIGLFLVAASATAAFAQGGKSADEHLRDARRAERAGDWATALAEMMPVYRAAPGNVDLLQHVARAHYELKHYIEAYEAYAELARRIPEPRLTTLGIPERLAELGSKTGTLLISVKEPGSDVTLDGQAIGSSPIEANRRVLPGRHVVTATKPGATPLQQSVDVDGGATIAVNLSAPPPSQPAPAPTPSTPSAPASAEPPTTPSAPASGDETWTIPHGSKQYAAVRVDAPPKIDGVLDEKMWQQALRDDRFQSLRSKPFGIHSTEPTFVQVAYDEENLYVAFRCGYSSPRHRDDSYPVDEVTLLQESESVSVVIDPLHDHANALGFGTTRVGARADFEVTQSGALPNLDWRGIWDVATTHDANGWTAEFKIPLGTLRLPRHDGAFDMGLNFRRREPVIGELSIWSLHPPATPFYDTNFFGHLTNLAAVRPSQRLFFQPYLALAYERGSNAQLSRLTDFAGTAPARAYGGFYARYRPPGPVRIDGTVNPDFSAVTPDQVVTNFDRFELQLPEARPFFAEDNPRFSFGAPNAQLFYSRRIGLKTNVAGVSQIIPMIYGAKGVFHSEGTEVAVMNAGLSTPDPKVEYADSVTVGRFNQTFAEGRRVGAIVLGRSTGGSGYVAGGVDGAFTLFDRHLSVSGFLARSSSRASGSAAANDFAGQTSLLWATEEFYGSASYLNIGNDFDGQLGYFPLTGIQSDVFNIGFTPIVHSDLLHQVLLESELNLTKDQTYNRVYDRGLASATAVMIDNGFIDVQLRPSIEQVAQDFSVASNRVTIRSGRYNVLTANVDAFTPARRLFVAGVGYLTGDLFEGQRRVATFIFKYNPGRFTGSAAYQLFVIRYGDTRITANGIRLSANYSYTPLAKTTLDVQVNSLSNQGVAQLVNSYSFGTLSTVALVLSATSGSAIDVAAGDWFDRPTYRAILSFALGLTPF